MRFMQIINASVNVNNIKLIGFQLFYENILLTCLFLRRVKLRNISVKNYLLLKNYLQIFYKCRNKIIIE